MMPRMASLTYMPSGILLSRISVWNVPSSYVSVCVRQGTLQRKIMKEEVDTEGISHQVLTFLPERFLDDNLRIKSNSVKEDAQKQPLKAFHSLLHNPATH